MTPRIHKLAADSDQPSAAGERRAGKRGRPAARRGAGEKTAAAERAAAPTLPAPTNVPAVAEPVEPAYPATGKPATPTSELRNAELPNAVWRVVSAAVIGAGHVKAGLPCQDAAGWRVTRDGTLLAAAADGAGTAERSDAGARLAVQTALETLEAAMSAPAAIRAAAADAEPDPDGEPPAPDSELQNSERLNAKLPNPELLIAAFAAARAALERLAEQEGRPLRDYAATLSLAAAGADYLLAGAIGDCAIVAAAAGDDGDGYELQTLIDLERGEYANETHFLTGDDALERLRLARRPQRAARLALFSDGLARLALQWPGQTPHRPFFAPLFAFAAGLPPVPGPGQAAPDPGEQTDAPVEAPTPAGENAAALANAAAQLAAFLGSERVNARTDDDKALVLAVSE